MQIQARIPVFAKVRIGDTSSDGGSYTRRRTCQVHVGLQLVTP